ncbi:MAG: DUF1127 domain-containing protein [Methyloligellaceae bacterium]
MSHSHKESLNHPHFHSLRELVMTGIKKVLFYANVIEQRRELMQLNDAQPKDIGLSRADVDFEYHRPFWDIETTPRHDFTMPDNGFSATKAFPLVTFEK